MTSAQIGLRACGMFAAPAETLWIDRNEAVCTRDLGSCIETIDACTKFKAAQERSSTGALAVAGRWPIVTFYYASKLSLSPAVGSVYPPELFGLHNESLVHTITLLCNLPNKLVLLLNLITSRPSEQIQSFGRTTQVI